MFIYLDTNVYCRPLDNQTNKRIVIESEAFLGILHLVKEKYITILGSDILRLEVEMIKNPYKKAEAKEIIKICRKFVEESEEIVILAEKLESGCRISGRDALHLASAITANVQKFVTCDDKLIKRSHQISKIIQPKKISIINPTKFTELFK